MLDIVKNLLDDTDIFISTEEIVSVYCTNIDCENYEEPIPIDLDYCPICGHKTIKENPHSYF